MKEKESENLILEVITMEEKNWDEFMKSGLVDDYLHYKGMQITGRVMDRYEKRDKSEQVLRRDADSNSDRNGVILRADWRI